MEMDMRYMQYKPMKCVFLEMFMLLATHKNQSHKLAENSCNPATRLDVSLEVNNNGALNAFRSAGAGIPTTYESFSIYIQKSIFRMCSVPFF